MVRAWVPGRSIITGLDYWNEWTAGMEHWTYLFSIKNHGLWPKDSYCYCYTLSGSPHNSISPVSISSEGSSMDSLVPKSLGRGEGPG